MSKLDDHSHQGFFLLLKLSKIKEMRVLRESRACDRARRQAPRSNHPAERSQTSETPSTSSLLSAIDHD